MADSSALQLPDLSGDNLERSRTEIEKRQLLGEVVSLEKLSKELKDDVCGYVQRRGVDMRLEFSPCVPQAFVGNSVGIRQVLSNLLSNAINHTDQGHVMLTVRICNHVTLGRVLRFMVEDTGAGMSVEQCQRVFEVFSEVGNSNARLIGGTGLGLAISCQLAALMGGALGFMSALGTGSAFWLDLPLKEVGLKPGADSVRKKRRSARSFVRAEGRRILVVEDNENNRFVAEAMFRRLGCKIDSVVNGNEAVEAVKSKKYDLILMDCQMPIMDGYTASRVIRAWENGAGRIPILAVTANVREGELEKCLESGMDDYLSKPFDMSSLESKLNAWIV